ncbi:MAG TPA: hypothetical protein VFU47_05335, partial [Armatimonadota bacterium]|nr:hypothetical protein [Armatimonadota bacterium]
MQKLVLAFFLGMFQGPATPAPAVPAPTVAAVAAPAETPPDYSRAPVAAAEAAAARGEVRSEREGTRYRFLFPDGSSVEFEDRARRSQDTARRERVVQYFGSQPASAEPESTFAAAGQAAGLSPAAIQALRFVSRHEGGFDAINTWDRARFSWGFIQFAGGYGLRPALAHFKSKSPDLFRQLLGRYGVDVLPSAEGRPEPVFVDTKSGEVLRGNAAEQAYGDDPLTIALFIRAARVTEVKQRQIEAAIRDYALPALTEPYNGVSLSDVLRSPRGMAMLIDRKVHEGNVSRLEWALE